MCEQDTVRQRDRERDSEIERERERAKRYSMRDNESMRGREREYIVLGSEVVSI